MPWYRAGTVSVTLNNNTVTGTGTAFSANGRVGDAWTGPDGRWYEVTNIASNTVLTISPNYIGATTAAGSYALAPMQGYVKDSADQLRQIVNQWGATLAGLGTVSTENVVPVTKGGTGASTVAAARTSLGLGTAATANIGVSAGNVMAVVTQGPTSNAAPTVVGFTIITTGTPAAGTAASCLTMNTGGGLFNQIAIAPNSLDRPTLGFRQFDNAGAVGVWNVVYTNQNTTRAADGTLKAI